MTTFRVASTGRFPVRMLHIDHCHPATQQDADKLADALLPDSFRGLRIADESTYIDLVQASGRPHVARWQEHGWEVVAIPKLPK